MNLLSIINLLLAHIYCSITCANYGLIRFNEFFSWISLRCYAISFIINLYLILIISMQTFDVTKFEVFCRVRKSMEREIKHKDTDKHTDNLNDVTSSSRDKCESTFACMHGRNMDGALLLFSLNKNIRWSSIIPQQGFFLSFYCWVNFYYSFVRV